MEENDVYFLDEERNAIVARPPAYRQPPPQRPAMIRLPPQARPWPPRPSYYQAAPPPRPMIIVQRPPSLLAGIDVGELVDHGVSVLAAIQSLPEGPAVTGEVARDVANSIEYQKALASHTKADERLRAFGGVAARVLSIVVRNMQQRTTGYFGG